MDEKERKDIMTEYGWIDKEYESIRKRLIYILKKELPPEYRNWVILGK